MDQSFKNTSVSFVIPCLNEEKNLPFTLDSCIFEAKKLNLNYEIIVIDNGSTDNSKTIAEAKGAKVYFESRKGYGSAITKGLLKAEKDICLVLDADATYDPSCLADMIYLHVERNFDLIIGNRWGYGIEKGAMPFLHKYLGNPVLSFIGRYLFDVKISDFHCGIRSIKTNLAKSLPFSVKGMEFATEMIVLTSIFKYKICEVSTKLLKSKYKRTAHLNTWTDGWRHLSYMLSMSPKKSFLFPGIVIQIFSILLLTRFMLINNINSPFAGINTFIFSYFLGLVSFILIKEYIESKYIMKIKLKGHTYKSSKSELKGFKYLTKASFLNFIVLIFAAPIITMIMYLFNISFQQNLFYFFTYIISNMIFALLLLNLLSFRLHILDL